MLHTPLKHSHPSGAPSHPHQHAPAQHPQTSTRCTPHNIHGVHPAIPPHAHELNLTEWLHMSPTQVAMMSPVAQSFTPPNHLFVQSPGPLPYGVVAGMRNDFMTTSPLPYSSPFHVAQYPLPNTYIQNSNFHQQPQPQPQVQVPMISISVENSQSQSQSQSLQYHEYPEVRPASSTSPGPGDASLLLSLNSDYYSYSNDSQSSTSPVSHHGSPFPYQSYAGPMHEGEGESTPVTTLSGADESHTQAFLTPTSTQTNLIDKLRVASPVTEASNSNNSSVAASPERHAPKTQSKPIESTESPFRIAAPQPRTGAAPFSPLPPSSRPTSALGSAMSPLSELAELASRRSTPAHPLAHSSSLQTPVQNSRPSSRPTSRPGSALSARSTKSHKTLRAQRPRRFAPSPLRVTLPYQQTPGSTFDSHGKDRQLTPSLLDTLPRGPLECEDDSHRYRTRSRLRSLKEEIHERERAADLLLIRRGLRGESGDAGEDKSRLEMLASVSITRRTGPDESTRAETPLAGQMAKISRGKRGTKRAFRDLDDGDCESVASSSASGSRTPSKRPRVATEKAVKAAKDAEMDVRSVRSTRASREKAVAAAHPAPVQTSRQRGKKAVSPPKSTKASPDPAPKKADVELVVDEESELSSLSSVSESEDAMSESEDMEYAPSKKSSRAKSSSISVRKAPAKKAAKAKGSSKAKATPVDIANGAAAFSIPTRTFPENVPMHAAFPLLYRKFPMSGYTDPKSFLAPYPAASEKVEGEAEEADGQLPAPASGHFNAPRCAEDLYTPRFVRGIGRDKMGLCPICYESVGRGGAGRAEWLSMKFSAFNYHMQYAHGISPITALPFSPPVAFRSVARTPNHKNEKTEILEGKCHRCEEWAPVEGVKCVEAKLKEIYWWKHTAACHKGSMIAGECDAHIDDALATHVRTVYKAMTARAHPSSPTTVSAPKDLFTTKPLI